MERGGGARGRARGGVEHGVLSATSPPSSPRRRRQAQRAGGGERHAGVPATGQSRLMRSQTADRRRSRAGREGVDTLVARPTQPPLPQPALHVHPSAQIKNPPLRISSARALTAPPCRAPWAGHLPGRVSGRARPWHAAARRGGGRGCLCQLRRHPLPPIRLQALFRAPAGQCVAVPFWAGDCAPPKPPMRARRRGAGVCWATQSLDPGPPPAPPAQPEAPRSGKRFLSQPRPGARPGRGGGVRRLWGAVGAGGRCARVHGAHGNSLHLCSTWAWQSWLGRGDIGIQLATPALPALRARAHAPRCRPRGVPGGAGVHGLCAFQHPRPLLAPRMPAARRPARATQTWQSQNPSTLLLC
jgi:hypothetical protein